MRAVILDGSREGDQACASALDTIRKALEEQGHDVRVLTLREMEIAECVGCFACWLRTPGECARRDDASEMLRALVQSQVHVALTRVAFGGYGGVLKTALDRIIPNISPLFTMRHGEMHHVLRYPAPSAWLTVGVRETADAEAQSVFARLAERNARNMDAPVSGAVIVPDDEADEARAVRIRELLSRLDAGAGAQRAAG